MTSAVKPRDQAERLPLQVVIARLWASGTDSVGMAEILSLTEAEVERIRVTTLAERSRPGGSARTAVAKPCPRPSNRPRPGSGPTGD